MATVPTYALSLTAAQQQYLYAADSTSFATGDIDWWLAGWFYLTSVASRQVLIGKSNVGTQSEYVLQFVTSPDPRFVLSVSADGDSFVSATASAYGAPTVDTWHFLLGWHDSVNNTINLRAGTTAAASTAHSTGTKNSTARFQIGVAQDIAFYFGGRADCVAFGKSPVGGIAGVVSALHASLYNGGAGKTYASLTAAEKTAWGLVSWWDLEEASGTRSDAHGTNPLTPAGSTMPGNATGLPTLDLTRVQSRASRGYATSRLRR